MTIYGILLVDTSWANDDQVQIDKATFHRHGETLVEGAKALIYVRAPIDAIVAEAELTGEIIETETMPPDPAFNPAIPANLRSERVVERIETEAPPPPYQALAHTYFVPLKLLRIKGQTQPIPLNRLQTILDGNFTVFDETWIPLGEDEYNAVVSLAKQSFGWN